MRESAAAEAAALGGGCFLSIKALKEALWGREAAGWQNCWAVQRLQGGLLQPAWLSTSPVGITRMQPANKCTCTLWKVSRWEDLWNLLRLCVLQLQEAGQGGKV